MNECKESKMESKINNVFKYGSFFEAIKSNYLTHQEVLKWLVGMEITDELLVVYRILCIMSKPEKQMINGMHFLTYRQEPEFGAIYFLSGGKDNILCYDPNHKDCLFTGKLTLISYIAPGYTKLSSDYYFRVTMQIICDKFDVAADITPIQLPLIVGSRSFFVFKKILKDTRLINLAVNSFLKFDHVECLKSYSISSIETKLITRCELLQKEAPEYWDKVARPLYIKLIKDLKLIDPQNGLKQSSYIKLYNLFNLFGDNEVDFAKDGNDDGTESSSASNRTENQVGSATAISNITKSPKLRLGEEILSKEVKEFSSLAYKISTFSPAIQNYLLGLSVEHVDITTDIRNKILTKLSSEGKDNYCDSIKEKTRKFMENVTEFIDLDFRINNETNTLLEEISSYSRFDIAHVIKNDQIYFFTRDEFISLQETGQNPYTRDKLPISFTYVLAEKMVVAEHLHLPATKTIRDLLNDIENNLLIPGSYNLNCPECKKNYENEHASNSTNTSNLRNRFAETARPLIPTNESADRLVDRSVDRSVGRSVSGSIGQRASNRPTREEVVSSNNRTERESNSTTANVPTGVTGSNGSPSLVGIGSRSDPIRLHPSPTRNGVIDNVNNNGNTGSRDNRSNDTLASIINTGEIYTYDTATNTLSALSLNDINTAVEGSYLNNLFNLLRSADITIENDENNIENIEDMDVEDLDIEDLDIDSDDESDIHDEDDDQNCDCEFCSNE